MELPNLIKTDLRILFVGINPGLRSGEIGHHFAGRSNRFWKFLFESGLTPSRISPEADLNMLELGYGITNIVPRVTATAAELTSLELKAGAANLKLLIAENHPKVVAYLGKVIYQTLAGRAKVDWGLQPVPLVDGTIDFVMPNPSGLNRMPIPEQLEFYKQLKELS